MVGYLGVSLVVCRRRLSRTSGLLRKLYRMVYQLSSDATPINREVSRKISAKQYTNTSAKLTERCARSNSPISIGRSTEWSRADELSIRAARLKRLFVTQSPDYLPPQRLTPNQMFIKETRDRQQERWRSGVRRPPRKVTFAKDF